MTRPSPKKKKLNYDEDDDNEPKASPKKKRLNYNDDDNEPKASPKKKRLNYEQLTRPLPQKKQLNYDEDYDYEPKASPKKKRLKYNDDDNEPKASPIGSRRSTRIAQLSPQKRILAEPNKEDKEKQPKKKGKKRAEIEKSPPLSNKVPSPIKKKTTKKGTAALLLPKQVEGILNKPASSPQKKKNLNNGVTNGDTLLSPSKRLPTVRYPSELGFEPETFGSLAKKKKKIDKP